MAPSKLAAALVAVFLVAGCQPAPPTPGPSSSAPVPRQYSCEQNKAAAKEYDTLPKGGTLRSWIDDYRIERKALRAFHQMPETTPCP